MRRLPASTFLALALVAAGTARAHEFWLEPTTYHAPVGRVVSVGLRVGEHFVGEPVPRDDAKIVSFRLHGPDGRRDVPGHDGSARVGLIRLDEPGLHTLAYRNRPSRLELDAERFTAYLREDGLEHVVAARAAAGDAHRPGRELYSRCAKCLIRAGDGPAAGWERVTGLPLELVPEADPHDAGTSELPVKLLYRGEPCPGVLIRAACAAAPHEEQLVRTDEAGRVRVRLDRGGVWLISGVHMVAAEPGRDAEWESVWASLTFAREAGRHEGTEGRRADEDASEVSR